mgnify:CR=1 FL=1
MVHISLDKAYLLGVLSLQVSSIVNGLLGPERGQSITIFAGDIVPKKKPDPVSKLHSFIYEYLD